MTMQLYFGDGPAPGFYRTRLVKRGPWVPVKIFLLDGERDAETGELLSDQKLVVRCGDQMKDWTWALERQPFLQPITRAEYDFLLARGRWAAAHDPHHPDADPLRPIDLGAMRAIF